MPSKNAKEVQAHRAAEEDARRRSGAAPRGVQTGKEQPSAHRPTMEDAKATPPRPDLASTPDSEVPRMVKTPEQAERVKQHAEVIVRLDAINASLQQRISLLSQAT